jgi:hypothetical protein
MDGHKAHHTRDNYPPTPPHSTPLASLDNLHFNPLLYTSPLSQPGTPPPQAFASGLGHEEPGASGRQGRHHLAGERDLATSEVKCNLTGNVYSCVWILGSVTLLKPHHSVQCAGARTRSSIAENGGRAISRWTAASPARWMSARETTAARGGACGLRRRPSKPCACW